MTYKFGYRSYTFTSLAIENLRAILQDEMDEAAPATTAGEPLELLKRAGVTSSRACRRTWWRNAAADIWWHRQQKRSYREIKGMRNVVFSLYTGYKCSLDYYEAPCMTRPLKSSAGLSALVLVLTDLGWTLFG